MAQHSRLLVIALCAASATFAIACADMAQPTAPRSLTTTASALTAAVPGDFATIQEAVDAAGVGDVVQVAAGTYNENLTLKTGVAVVGSGIETTTVYGTVTISSATGVTVSDLTLRGDLTTGATGIDAVDATFTLERAIVRDFAVCVRVSGTTNATISRSQLQRSDDDGLLVEGAASVTMTNSVLSTNQRHGLRIVPGATGSVTVTNSLMWGNGWPSQGAALKVGAAGFDLNNTIVTANRGGLDCSTPCSNDYSIIWGNFTDYADLAVAGLDNKAVDPQLTNLNEGEFTLLAQSPAIDAGTSTGAPDIDYFGLVRPSGSGVDIGPHEYPQNVVAPIIITEVMANPFDEGDGEFVEIMNPGSSPIDVKNWVIDDGDSIDFLKGWKDGPTVIPPGGFGVILDPDYDETLPTFSIAAGAIWLTLTGSTTIGSGLSTGDPVTLSQGLTLIDSFSFPFNPGNGVSAEKESIEDGDVAGNWVASPCGSSPGADNCAWAPPTAPNQGSIVITEIMSNPLVEKSGEYIELYNNGTSDVDVAGWIIDDGDSQDSLTGWQGGTTVIPADTYAVILDPDYADQYLIDAAAVLLTITSSVTLGNALSTNDPLTLRDSSNTVVDTFSHPFDPGNGISVERDSPSSPDNSSSWDASTCLAGGSPGAGDCVATPPVQGPTTIAITEVMANALNEDTGEFVELFNYGSEPVDLEGWRIDDDDKVEPLGPFFAGTTTLLQPGAFALIMDIEYVEGTYAISSSVLRLRTPDSSIASGLATTDVITLSAPDGSVVSTWSTPFNPGNGVSAQQLSLAAGDVPSNWVATECGASPGDIDCAGGPPTVDIALSPLGIVISEVMSNPLSESTGEFVELFNAGTSAVDLTTLSVLDYAYTDDLVAYNAGPTMLQPGDYGLILDPNFAGQYPLPAGGVVVTTPDIHIGNGLAVTEPFTLFNGSGDVISTYGYPLNAGNGFSVERAVITGPDSPDAWAKSTCASGSSPGLPNCNTPGSPATASIADGEACPFGSGECAGGVCMYDALTDVSLCASDCSSAVCAAGFVCAATGDVTWSEVCWPEAGGPVDPTPTGVEPLLISEIVVSPSAAEYIEIYNPNATAVALDYVYLADYYGYEGVTVGNTSPNSADFRMHFPAGSTIAAGAYATISMESASHFQSEHGQYPDYDTWPSDGNAPSMVGQIGNSAGLGNGSEMVVLFYWEGVTPLVADLDYIVYGSSASYGMDKTGVSVGTSAYADETALASQAAAPAPGYAAALERCDLAETGQTATGGNGANGEDHTSEPMSSTWQVVANPTPGAAGSPCAAPCVPTCAGDCGSDGCGGSCGTCSADQVCEVDTCQAKATGLTLSVVNKAFGGWKLPDGFGATHTLLMFMNAADFQTYFGKAPPSEADFATENVVFFATGNYYLSAGNSAVVTEVVDNTTELFVFTQRTYPADDCYGLSVPVPVWNMYTVTKPSSGATTLTEIYGEEEIWCFDPGSAQAYENCGSTKVCGEDLICVGLTYDDNGYCSDKAMWGIFYGPTPAAIPDAGSVTIPLFVSTLASVEVDVVIYVEITHPDPSQLTLTMLNPLNEEGDISQSVTVFDQEAVSGPNLLIHRAILGFSGDEVANGEWALVVEDKVAGSTGTVNVVWTEMTSRWD